MPSRLILDDFSIDALVDARPEPVAVTWSFPTVAENAWSGLCCAGLDAEGRFSPGLGCFLIRNGNTYVLCDAGIGPGPNAYLGGLSGRLPSLLAQLGLDRSVIDVVAFTHLHMDHVGWASSAAGAYFPNAVYYAPAKDLAYFADGAPGTGRHHRDAFDTCVRPLVDAGVLRGVDEDTEIMPGLRYRASPGHTPGHQCLIWDAEPHPVCITGDVFHCPAQIERPGWSHRADLDPETARHSRLHLIEQAVARNWILAAGHFRDGIQFGRIEREGEGHVWRPAPGEWNQQQA